MSNPATDRFIYPDSPFLPGPDPNIIRNIRQKNNFAIPAEITVASELRGAPALHSPLTQITELHRKFKTTPENLRYYMLGFDVPLATITCAYIAKQKGEAEALRLHITSTSDALLKRFHSHLKSNLANYVAMYKREPSGRLIFLDAENNPLFSDIYYQVGVRAAKISYMNYAELLGADFS